MHVCARFCIVLAIIGILFVKDKGQHILKNPLVINSMIEKVRTLVGSLTLYR